VPLPNGVVLNLGERALVMGILNVTPDSFAETGSLLDPRHAVDAALDMEARGADLIDVGGESTRPGADPLPAADELARVLPVIERLAARLHVPNALPNDELRRGLEALASEMMVDIALGEEGNGAPLP